MPPKFSKHAHDAQGNLTIYVAGPDNTYMPKPRTEARRAEETREIAERYDSLNRAFINNDVCKKSHGTRKDE
jgi:hypothetical protein